MAETGSQHYEVLHAHFIRPTIVHTPIRNGCGTRKGFNVMRADVHTCVLMCWLTSVSQIGGLWLRAYFLRLVFCVQYYAA